MLRGKNSIGGCTIAIMINEDNYVSLTDYPQEDGALEIYYRGKGGWAWE